MEGILMKFKAGQRVICTAPHNNLVLEAIYEINDCHISKIPGIEQANEFVTLKEFPDETFMSFRFRPYEEEESFITLPAYEVLPATIYNSGASKNDKEKVDLSLIPKISNTEHAKAFMVGERKYSRYNYCKGHKASQLVAAAKRHLDAWFECEERDPVDGQHHLGSVMACCSMILRQQELGTLKDDRYKNDNN